MSKKHSSRKYREDQEATAHVFQDFLDTFQATPTAVTNKVFVKSEVLNPTTPEECQNVGTLYRPSVPPNIAGLTTASTNKVALECARIFKCGSSGAKRSSGSTHHQQHQQRPKSNLQQLNEELKQRQAEREQRKVTQSQGLQSVTANTPAVFAVNGQSNGPCPSDDHGTTNLFISNLSLRLTEQDLMTLFGDYGPLASVKIMWPRQGGNSASNGISNDSSGRNTHCGFVAFMCRRDAERALRAFQEHRPDMNITWGKPVELPAHPVHIPQSLMRLLLPTPHSGLPFNAYPALADRNRKFDCTTESTEIEAAMARATVRVTVPLDKKQNMAINRVAEFVIREGPTFEAIIMNYELNNPLYRFLFDNKSPAHAYYRWRLYSLAHGESTAQWSAQPFRMFQGGAIWIPPAVSDFTQGMPEHLVIDTQQRNNPSGNLSSAQEQRLINHIAQMQPTRVSIRDVMLYCVNHSSAYRDIVDILTTSLLRPGTPLTKKVARLYLISDVLYNCQHNAQNNVLITEFEKHLPAIFEHLAEVLDSTAVAERNKLRVRILRTLFAWRKWKLYDKDFQVSLENYFDDDCNSDNSGDYPVDGNQLRSINMQIIAEELAVKSENRVNADIVLSILESNNQIIDIGSKQHPKEVARNETAKAEFIASKWESVDPSELEANSMSSQKLCYINAQKELQTYNPILLDGRSNESSSEDEYHCSKRSTKDHTQKSKWEISDSDDDDLVRPSTIALNLRGERNKASHQGRVKYKGCERKHKKLREIELMVMEYQDDLENGQIDLGSNDSIEQAISVYREKLLKLTHDCRGSKKRSKRD